MWLHFKATQSDFNHICLLTHQCFDITKIVSLKTKNYTFVDSNQYNNTNDNGPLAESVWPQKQSNLVTKSCSKPFTTQYISPKNSGFVID